MTSTILLLTIGGSIGITAAFGQSQPPNVIDTREFVSENGRTIRISSLGNLIRLQTPTTFDHLLPKIRRGSLFDTTRPREGYALVYIDPLNGQARISFDVYDLYSMTQTGERTLVPVLFEAPATANIIPFDATMRARSIVDTSDGLLRLIHDFTWQAGTGEVSIATTVLNRQPGLPVGILRFARFVDADVDGRSPGSAGKAETKTTGKMDSILISGDDCNSGICPPDPDCRICPDQASLRTHVMVMRGIPAPSYKLVNSVADPSAILSGGGGQPAPDWLRFPGDRQAALVWQPNSNLGPNQHITFQVEYKVH
jgi:hypothetical protein